MRIGVMITSRNRCSDLRRTIGFVNNLRPAPSEVLVTADGCSDDTARMLQEEFPDVILTINDVGRGSVASRAAMMETTSCDLILALDDDSHPEQSNTLAFLTDQFKTNSRLAIATFPQRSDEYPESLTCVNFGEARPIRSFPNSGACLRVSTYRELAGFEPLFFHMYEEPDYALQCVANGWEAIFFPDITIRHYWTPNERSEIRNHHLHARNEFWSTLMRCPFPYAFAIIIWRVFSQARYAFRRGPSWFIREPIWWFHAIRGVRPAISRRRPVSWEGYLSWISIPD